MVPRINQGHGQGSARLIGDARRCADCGLEQFTDDAFGVPTVADILAESKSRAAIRAWISRTASFKEGFDTIGYLKPGMGSKVS